MPEVTLKIPVRGIFDADTGEAEGLAEFQSEEVISIKYGGTGVSSVLPNAILVGGTDVDTMSQITLPDGHFLTGGQGTGAAPVATNIIDCGTIGG